MSLLLNMMGAATPDRNPDDDRWWGEAASVSLSGQRIDADTALKISTVYACVGLVSETVAALPLVIYRWIENNEGRERARNNPLYDLLRWQANVTQTAMEFKEAMTAHAMLRGSGYAEIVPGARGFADQLVPIHPDRVTKERLTNGRFRYQVRNDNNGGSRPFNQDDIFEVGGLSLDGGLTTVSVIKHAKESMGLALSTEAYGSRFFRNDSRPGGVLETAGRIKDDKALMRLKSSWEAAHAGGNQHRVAILEDGITWKQMSIAPEEAQFLQTRTFQAEDICRWFRVPPHMVGLTDKTTSWGSGIEQMGIGFLTYTLQPWLTRWSQSIRRDLIIADKTYFADFITEALLRGDIATRYDAYSIARQWGWMSVDDVRARENMNPLPNGSGKIYLTPMNMDQAGAASAGSANAATTSTGSVSAMDSRLRGNDSVSDGMDSRVGGNDSESNGHYRLLAEEAAGRLVRKEQAALTRFGKNFSGNAWETAVSDFYAAHVELVAQTMRVSLETAVSYCDSQADSVIHNGVEAGDPFWPHRAADLAAMAVGGAQ